MGYRVQIRSTIRRRIVAWNLPDSVFVEILLRLERELGQNPTEKLARLKAPFNGMTYGFAMVDPTNRFREFTFVFHLTYGQDEETLQVVNCGYHVTSL